MRKKIVAWELIASLFLTLAFSYIQCPLPARAADTSAIVSAAAQILYNNEGSYTSVAADDNGALSVGKLQWHGNRALALLQSIAAENDAQAQELLGDSLYTEVTTSQTSSWNTRKLTTQEVSLVKALLGTDESKAAQDVLANKDITDYITHGKQQGITNEAALVYYADIENQGGAVASKRVGKSAANLAGSYAGVTLNELHEAAICDSVMGVSAYYSRRFATYKYAVGLGWTYCNSNDSYIPYDYASAKSSGAQWIQKALNTCMKAQLKVTGSYDDATLQAVKEYQKAKGLTVDGYAGRSTIVKLIQSVVNGETVQKVTDQADSSASSGSDTTGTGSDTSGTGSSSTGSDTADPSLKATTLKASKTSYKLNDNHKDFQLSITSNHVDVGMTFKSGNVSVAEVSSSGKVSIKGAGSTKITVSQAGTKEYQSASISISLVIYDTNPQSYEVPTTNLYAAKKNMKKSHIQWLQATLNKLDKTKLKVNGKWSENLTKAVTNFQSACGLSADGNAGTMTIAAMKQCLAVKLGAPKASASSTAAANTVSWNKDANANCIYIYRRTGNDAFKRIKTLKDMTKLSFSDTKAESGKSYDYAVRYGVLLGKKKVLSSYSNTVTGVRK